MCNQAENSAVPVENTQKETYIRELFGLSEERIGQLANKTFPFVNDYNEGNITTCDMLSKSLAACDTEEEKQYVAYVIGSFVGEAQASFRF